MNLLILDIDETLVHAAEEPLERAEDFRVGPYFVYLRPFLDEFLRLAGESFEVATWTSSTEGYAASVLERLPFVRPPVFSWSRDRCTRVFDPELQGWYWVKDLKKVKRAGYDLDRVLMVDDTPKKLSRHYGSFVRVLEFFGDEADDELPLLARYLSTLSHTESVRSIEKRGWRASVQDRSVRECSVRDRSVRDEGAS